MTSIPSYPSDLAKREDELIAQRREQTGTITSTQPRFGLALSGGGIRSATFSLGVLQGLAKAGLLRRFDYLSTVSGGGYIGGFLGALYARKHLPNGCPTAATRVEEVEAILADSTSPPLNWLRENGRYLTPNGGGDALFAAGYALRNWVSILVVMATLALAIFLSVDALGILIANLETNGDTRWFGAPTHPGLVWWSPWLLLPLITFVGWAVPAGWAFWLVAPSNRRRSPLTFIVTHLPTITTVVIALIPAAWCLNACCCPTECPMPSPALMFALAAVPVLTLILRIGAGLTPTVARLRLTNWLATALTITAILLAFALIDSLGRSLYAAWACAGIGPWLSAGVAGLVAAFAAVQRFASLLVPSGESRRPPPTMLLLGAGALLVHATLLIVVCAAAHGISWGGQQPRFAPTAKPAHIDAPIAVVDGTLTIRMPITPSVTPTIVGSSPNTAWTITGTIAAWVLSFSFAWAMPFVNHSALAGIYAARLTRSYLGASNPDRLNSDARITEVLPSDDLDSGLCHPTHGYHPEAKGGPLHLINLTINETVDGRSQLQQQDRKGMGMAVGPAGLSVGLRHHACPTTHGKLVPCENTGGYQVFKGPIQPEPLSLGQLVGISGAAFSTGLGSRTSIALSLLCGLFNVRTGYWWDHDQKRFCLFGVQGFLLHEWLARFPGTAWRHWYLSDGGHFENLACYELIRRRLPLIICCDDGEDPQYAFEDIGILARKARIDFGADLRFLDHGEIVETLGAAAVGFIGTLDDLRPPTATNGQPPRSKAHAALARLTYADGSTGLLLLIKPTLSGDEAEDVRHYQRANPAFPHEPTIDQFFDEAQWESYRKLGEVIAGRLITGGVLPSLMGTTAAS